jgi:ribosomal protein S18 acetylase RimI-like enzyme
MTGDPKHLHIHAVDMPYRMASTWQDLGCEMGIWEKNGTIVAWALFQPAWWNLDFAIHPTQRGSSLAKDLLEWGKNQINLFAERSKEDFFGSVEFFEDAPEADQIKGILERLGFEPFSWSTNRLMIDHLHPLHPPPLTEGFKIRPFGGIKEVDAYVDLHQLTFDSDKMTTVWRQRILQVKAYRPEIDLVVVDPDGILAGFCIGWMWGEFGQIEPLGIHPDYQGMGLGKALETTSVNALWALGARHILIDHLSTNENAISNSQAIGFKKVNTALRYYAEAKPMK